MKLNKSQRNKVFIKAKELFVAEPAMNGLCFALNEAIIKLHGECVGYSSLETVLPEFHEIVPHGMSPGMRWWPVEYKEIRIEKLDELIEMTKP